MNLSEEKLETIFTERAKKLAKPFDFANKQKTGVNSLNLVLIKVNKEIYAFNQQQVKEILPLRTIAKLPSTPDFIEGIIYYRGHMVAVNNLSRLFNLPTGEVSEEKKVLIISDGKLEMAILADSVIGTQSLLESEIQNELPTMKDIQLDLTIGITPEGACLLSAAKMLTYPKLIFK